MTETEPKVYLGYIQSDERGAGDLVLTRVAERLRAAGTTVHGAIQCNTERADGGLCDMDVSILPNGRVLRVSQNLGREARGCRLDAAALEQAVADVKQSFSPTAALLLINKFGKQEAAGGGFRGLIGDAIGWGVPVLTSVNRLNIDAFEAYTAGTATKLPAREEALLEWFQTISEERKL